MQLSLKFRRYYLTKIFSRTFPIHYDMGITNCNNKAIFFFILLKNKEIIL